MNKVPLMPTSLEIREDEAFIIGSMRDQVTRLWFEIDVTDLVKNLLNKPWEDCAKNAQTPVERD